MTGHDGYIGAVALRLFSAAGHGRGADWRQGDVRTWEMRSGLELCEPLARKEHVASLDLSPDGSRMLIGSWGGRVELWTAPAR